MSPCVCPCMCHTCSIHPLALVVGSTLTCSRSCASLLFMILPSCGEMALEVHQRLNYKARQHNFLLKWHLFLWYQGWIVSISTPVFSVTWSFRIHSILIWCSRNIYVSWKHMCVFLLFFWWIEEKKKIILYPLYLCNNKQVVIVT